MTAATRGRRSALVALTAMEVAARIAPGVPSPVGAVADTAVALLPTGLVSPLLQVLRSAGRPLTLAVVAVAVVLAGGVVARWAGSALGRAGVAVVAIVTVGALAQLAQPGAAPLATALVALGGAIVAIALLADPSSPRSASLTDTGTVGGTVPGSGGSRDVGRRRILAALVGGGAVTAVGATLGRTGRMGTRPGSTVLPPVATPLAPLTAAQDLAPSVPGLAPIMTPIDDFYRIDTALSLPRIDVSTWRLTISGRVEREVTLTFDELVALGIEEVDATIACVSNEVGGGLIGTARWAGVPLERVLALAGVRADAEQLVARSVDGFTAGFPLTVLDDARRAIVAVGMQGEPLPVRHGHPARLVVPGLYGYVSATKWLAAIELTGWDEFDAYWVPRGWAKEAPVKTSSRIDVPREGERVAPGDVVVAGVAWAPTRGIAAVEVRVDEGAWTQVSLSERVSDDTWVQWRTRVALGAGDHTLEVRAIDGTGDVQSEGPRPVIPDGAEGWHRRMLRVG